MDALNRFWELNPQLIYVNPISSLYRWDTSLNREVSSRIMWYINFMQNPDEEDNVFYRFDIDQRKSMLIENFNIDEDLLDIDVVKEVYNNFSILCMTSIKRALKVELDSINKRKKLMEETELTLDETVIENGKSIIIKGTASQINNLQKDFIKIMDNYEKVQAKYNTEKASLQAKGGQYIPKGERLRND